MMVPPSPSAVEVRDRQITALGVVGFVAALAAASQVAIPIPGTPVPMSLQPLAVVLAGLWLGPIWGPASMLIYLSAGALGVPVFAPVGPAGIARLAGPTGGYLLAYPAAAAVAGYLGRKVTSFPGRVAAAALAIGVIYLGGLAQLTIITGNFRIAVALGSVPFVAVDAIKALLAALLSPSRSNRAPL